MFVYGLLQPGFKPPQSTTRSWPDRVRGELFDLGDFPGARSIGVASTWFEGSVLEIDEAELVALDEFEDTASSTYVRRRIVTEQGKEVWIYEYLGRLPEGATTIPRWPFP